MATPPKKLVDTIVEYLDQGRFRAGLVVREQNRHLAVLDATGREKLVARDIVLMHHPARKADRLSPADALGALEMERAQLGAELDLNLLWEVVHEQGRSFTAEELAELFFGRRSSAAASVMLEALLNDRLYFVRRHMEFVPRSQEQVERLRVQAQRIRMRSQEYRDMQRIAREVLQAGEEPAPERTAQLVEKLKPYVLNPFTRDRDLTAILEEAVPEVDPAETAFEILDRLGEAPNLPRFATIAGLKSGFSEAALIEAQSVAPPERPPGDGGFTITIDDQETLEVDDAVACEKLADGSLRVRVHIALVADFVARGGALDREAAERATTVYLPETTVRMLPDAISCGAASLVAGEERPVLTTEVRLGPDGEILESSIYPDRIRVCARLDYDQADRRLAEPGPRDEIADTLCLLNGAAAKLRERRKRAGALLLQRREAKVRVRDGETEIYVLDTSAPSRLLVGELMVLSNYVAARYAAEARIPIIYRVQPRTMGELTGQRPKLSLYPEYHAGIGLDFYAQFSSPIRRYADLVLQRQMLGALSRPGTSVYSVDELLKVLAGAENAELEGRELERRAKRYWTLRYLERHARNRELRALATREGASAELIDFAIRGTLHGAPLLPNNAPIMVHINRIDPLRGWLSLDYLRPHSQVGAAAR